MTTVTLWLLISLGQTYYGGSPTVVVERFADQASCERVKRAIDAPRLTCVEAKVARP